MFSSEISSEHRELIQTITPQFSESLRRAFRNQGCRGQKLKIHHLDDVLYADGDNIIELRSLKFPWIPDFRINELSADLSMLCLDVNFKLGDLRVEGIYDAYNVPMQRLLPVSNNGKIIITFHNVIASGRIGLLIVEDSFVPENYDLVYEPTEVTIRVNYHLDNDNVIENEISKANVEDTLGLTVWVQLNELITELLSDRLGDVVVDFSVQELLADEDHELRERARERSMRANKLLDSLLCSAKDFIVAEDYRSVTTPSFNVIYRGKPTGVQLGTLSTGLGYIRDLSTLTRLRDVSLYEDKERLVVYGSLYLREFKYGYESYCSSFEESRVAGAIHSTIYKNKIFVKISVVKIGENCRTQLDTVQIRMLKDINVDSSGLGSISWLAPKLKSWVIGNLRNNALGVLERYIRDAFTVAIRNTDCVGLLID